MTDSLLPGENSAQISRRDFLLRSNHNLLGAAVLTLCPLSLSASDVIAAKLKHLDNSNSLLVAEIARFLFPHSELSDSIYLDVAKVVDADMANNENLGAMFRNLASTLDNELKSKWSAASNQSKVQLLISMQEQDWFAYLRNRTIETLYRHPKVWALIGYQGSSIEQGGYLNRGFDDIDWLESTQEHTR